MNQAQTPTKQIFMNFPPFPTASPQPLKAAGCLDLLPIHEQSLCPKGAMDEFCRYTGNIDMDDLQSGASLPSTFGGKISIPGQIHTQQLDLSGYFMHG